MIHKHIHKHIDKKVISYLNKHFEKHGHHKTHHKIHKFSHITMNSHHYLSHGIELVFIICFVLFSFMFANTNWNLINNSSLIYPLDYVSTLECRTQSRENMSDECKIKLPIIQNSNYIKYASNKTYRDIYTVLRWANYSDTWNQNIGWHAAVDIATAKGTPLYSIADGEIYYAWWNNSYGNVIKLKFKYNWEILYAIYAHMDEIYVESWQKISKWSQIWTVWNSWNVFGALWWNHIHFEINKDSYWRPAYYYYGCPELNLWHSSIIKNWYCRKEVFNTQYDPIMLIESSLWRGSYINNLPIIPFVEPETTDPVEPETTDPVELETTDPVKPETTDPVEPETTDPIEPETTDPIKPETTDPIEPETTDPIEPETTDPVEPETTDPDSWNSHNSWWDKDEIILNPEYELAFDIETEWVELELDFSNIQDELTKHFLTQHNIKVFSNLDPNTIKSWDTFTIIIQITNKKTWEPTKWELLIPIKMITINNNLTLKNKNIHSVVSWFAQSNVIVEKQSDYALIINLWDEKIWAIK